MKHVRARGGAPAGRRRFPRRTRRGLIEATQVAPRTVRGYGFPRRTRRGLIEAGPSPRPSARRSADFPGGHAGASLKRPVAGAGARPSGADFPGGHAGASLKHPAGEAAPAQPAGGFPRRTRRGLIEAESHPQGGAVTNQHFPGGHAGASLKPPFGLGPGRDLSPFPRRTRRGLIEASRPSGRSSGPRRISPADTPGPH